MKYNPKRKKTNRRLLVVVLYVAALLVYLIGSAVAFGLNVYRTGKEEMEWQQLRLEDFELVSILQLKTQDGKQFFVSTDPDPQLIYQPESGRPIRNLYFSAKATNKPSGEITLYWSTRQDKAFSEKNKLWAQQDPAGRWYFDLGGKTITALRIDPDTTGGVVWSVDRITLNEPKLPQQYFIPSILQGTALLFVPAFLSAFILEVESIITPYVVRRRFDNRWREKQQQE